MTKGNNGNYLQHSIELANASFLQQYNKEKSIHISLTHGMAPYEPCDHCADKDLYTRNLLQSAFDLAQNDLLEDAHPILHAYRGTNAKFENYPNTGELLAAIIGRDHLFGTIAEVDEEKCHQLNKIWIYTNVEIFNNSWRNGVKSNNMPLCSPKGLNKPWLFSMDPNVFSQTEEQEPDKGNTSPLIYQSDRGFITTIINSFLESKQPGIATIFSYGQKNTVNLFKEFATNIAENTSGGIAFYNVPLRGGNEPIGAVIYYNMINDNRPIYPVDIEQI